MTALLLGEIEGAATELLQPNKASTTLIEIAQDFNLFITGKFIVEVSFVLVDLSSCKITFCQIFILTFEDFATN